MRTYLLLGAAAFSLAACGGAGPESVGSVAAPVGGTGTGASSDPYDQFVKPTEAKTYVGIGGTQNHRFSVDQRIAAGQQGEQYGGNATTVRNSSISVSYDPRDAIFTLKIADTASGASTETRFQDPASRTDFANTLKPQWGTPDLNTPRAAGQAAPYPTGNIQFLQASEGNPLSKYREGGSGFINPGTPTVAPTGTADASYQSTTFFYEKPGTSTKYVTLAGYLNNRATFTKVQAPSGEILQDQWSIDRGAFAYGMLTENNAVPTSGTASYAGNMLGTMVYNPTLDDATALPSFFQWLAGTSKVSVDFGSKAVGLQVAGVVLDPQATRYVPSTTAFIPAGSTFQGAGSATIDMVAKGGFTGSFAGGNFTFTAPTGGAFADGSTTAAVNVAGSSIDGAFYGPKANEVGGGFRVVGGVPDQRVDIVGAFTGK